MDNRLGGALGDFDARRARRLRMGRSRYLALLIATVALWGQALLVSLLGATAYAQGRGWSASPLQSSKAPGSGLEPALHFTHLTADEGLAQNAVTAILQDRRG